MSNDYRTTPLSNQQIEEFAASTRQKLGLGPEEPFDVVAVVKRDLMPTRFGLKTMSLRIVPDGSLQGDYARTLALPKHVSIELEDAVWINAQKKQNRAVMTVAHELGHTVLHEKPVPLARAAPSFEGKRPDYLAAYESAEHQAKYFGAAILIPKAAVERSRSATDLTMRYNVSLQAAEIRLRQFASREPRKTPDSIRDIIEELRANNQAPTGIKPIYKSSLTAWDKLPTIQGNDPTEYRLSFSGYRLKKSEYNKVNCQGWFIEGGRVVASLERHDCN